MSKEIGEYHSIKEYPRFGKISVDLGYINEEQLKTALDEQVKNNISNKPHINIGRIFLNKKWITYEQILEVLDKSREKEHNVSAFIKAIKRDVRALRLIILLTANVLVFINLSFLSKILNYLPPFSIATIFFFVLGLISISFYLSKLIANKSVEELVGYDKSMNGILNSLRQEIEERKKIEDEIRFQSRQNWEGTFNSINDLITIHDLDFNIINSNNAAKERLQLPDLEVHKEIKCFKYFHGTDSPPEGCPCHKCFETGAPASFDMFEPYLDKYIEIRVIPRFSIDKQLIGLTHIVRDITGRKELEKKLYSLSITDELTGLYNRRGFLTLCEQQLKLANRDNKKMFLMSADIDSLKQINDTVGHKIGDLAIISIADILKETFRESDIVARIGGDEFVILGIDTPDTNIDTLAGRLRENLNAHNSKETEPLIQLSLSYGFTKYDPKHPYSIEELLAKADKLMYEEKHMKK